MKVLVPPAPVEVEAEKAKPKPRSSASLTEAFDAGFVGRIIASILGVGAFVMLAVLSATQSPQVAVSVFGGFALAAVLLKSQDLFVRRVLGPVSTTEKNLWMRAPLAVVLVFKYIAVGAILGIGLQFGWLQPVALGIGFIAGQGVIVAKVIGRFIALKLRANSEKSNQNIESHVA
jgi:hypothetical protein